MYLNVCGWVGVSLHPTLLPMTPVHSCHSNLTFQAEKAQEKAQSQVSTYSEVGKQGELSAYHFKSLKEAVVLKRLSSSLH